MSSITEQFSAAAKSQLEAQFQIFSTFASTAVASAEKLMALNISTSKQLFAARDPREFFRAGAAEPAGYDQLLAYGRELASIAATAQSELIKSTQNSIKQVAQVTDLAATPATVAPKTPPVLAAAVSAAVGTLGSPAPSIVGKTETPPANEPVAAPPPPKAAKAPARPKPVAAPIAAAGKPAFPATKLRSVTAKAKK